MFSLGSEAREAVQKPCLLVVLQDGLWVLRVVGALGYKAYGLYKQTFNAVSKIVPVFFGRISRLLKQHQYHLQESHGKP